MARADAPGHGCLKEGDLMPRAPKKCAREGCETRGVGRYCPAHKSQWEYNRTPRTSTAGHKACVRPCSTATTGNAASQDPSAHDEPPSPTTSWPSPSADHPSTSTTGKPRAKPVTTRNPNVKQPKDDDVPAYDTPPPSPPVGVILLTGGAVESVGYGWGSFRPGGSGGHDSAPIWRCVEHERARAHGRGRLLSA